MGSEGPLPVTVYVTGFRKFYGVADNPTETIVSNLKDFIARRGISSAVTLETCTVLEAAGFGTLPKLYEIMESALSKSLPQTSSDERVIWLHFGANGGASKFAIERQAINEATFLHPDQLGWQPRQVPVVPEDGSISRTRVSTCSVDMLAKVLKTNGYDVVVSDDADRFVCNYVYYHSLRFAEQNGHKSLFVHVPLFSRIDEDTQMQFVASLLEELPYIY